MLKKIIMLLSITHPAGMTNLYSGLHKQMGANGKCRPRPFAHYLLGLARANRGSGGLLQQTLTEIKPLFREQLLIAQ